MVLRHGIHGLIILALIMAALLETLAQTPAQRKKMSGKPGPPASISILEGNREQDGLIGPIRRVRTETARLSTKAGKLIEGPRQLVEVTTYNPAGQRMENTSYPLAPSHNPVGKQDFKYDDKGNVIEMILRGPNNAILSREVYTYEFDSVGNWTKMMTFLVVFENGVRYEPVEVTYRTISYYAAENIAKVREPAANLKITGAPPKPAGSLVGNPRSKPVAEKVELPEPKARLVSEDEPDIAKVAYPEEAKKLGVGGIVTVKVTLDAEGKVINALAVSGHEMLRAAAVEAAMNSRFLPGQSERSAIISFTFSLLP